jgi:hypothetical protein
MSYIRIYPDKNNTIFKSSLGSIEQKRGFINTGQNPIMELNDGASFSRMLLGFSLEKLKEKLEGKSYTCNLKLFDAGELRETEITAPFKNSLSAVKPIDIFYFNSLFIEGDGFHLSEPSAVIGASNWVNRTVGTKVYKGEWDANANTPELGLPENNIGNYYKVATSGFQTLNGETNPIYYNEGDWVMATQDKTNTPIWFKIENLNDTVFQTPWTNEFETPVKTIQLQSKVDDIIVKNLETYVENSIENDLNCSFALSFDSRDLSDTLYSKFVYSRHTKTIFKPFLEFFINDTIKDDRNTMKVVVSSNLYLTNQNFEDIPNLSVKIINLETGLETEPSLNNLNNGVYNYTYTPTSDGEYEEVWRMGANVIKRSILKTVPLYNFNNNLYSNLYFYPTTYYNKGLIRKGDVIKANLIARNKNKIFLSSDFEYKIVTTSDFTVTPWQSISLSGEEMFFRIDTFFFYEEIEYEVFVRLKNNDRTQTGDKSYKFRVIYDGASRFDDVHASPYSDRNIYLKR